MSYLINQVSVMNSLHNLMGHRVAPGGESDDYKRFIQASFDYCWRYYQWPWAVVTGSTDADGILPDDFDLDGYFAEKETYDVIWDSTEGKLRLDGITEETPITYQIAPPTLGTDAAGSAPFPSAQVVAVGATVYAKLADNPTRADVSQEWDMFHAELDRLVGRSDRNRVHTPVNFHDIAGTFTGDVGA